jgi:hypothetical protein
MSVPEQLPEPPEDFEGNAPSDARPDWLVGAEEGAASEIGRSESATDVKLVRPMVPRTEDLAGREATVAGGVSPPRPSTGPAKPVAWTGAGNSVPRLTAVPAARRPAGYVSEPDEDDDDAEVRPGLDADVIGDDARPAANPPRPLHEPLWMVLIERIATERRLQLLIALVLTLVAVLVFWPRDGGHSVAVRDIRRNPEHWEGRSVTVRGRVGDVFPLGSGYVFNLHQGRDTIVVFTRAGHPERSSRVQVTGEVSAGYLDGSPRLAILETQPQQH